MIRDGQLVHGLPRSSFWSWHFQSPVADYFSIAIVTTLISYQAVGLVFDLILGFRAPNVIKVSDIHILQLVRESSPLSITASVLNSQCLINSRLLGSFNKVAETLPTRHRKRPRLPVLLKLSILLVVAPVLNMVSVLLTAEKDVVVTFSDANFGGLSVGFNEDLSSVHEYIAFESFKVYPVALLENQTPLSEFCMEIGEQESESYGMSEVAYVSVSVGMKNLSPHVITIETFLRGRSILHTRIGTVYTRAKPFVVPVQVSSRAFKAFFRYALDLLRKECEAPNAVAKNMTEQLFKTRWSVYSPRYLAVWGIGCRSKRAGVNMERIRGEIQKPLSFQQEDQMLVEPDTRNGRIQPVLNFSNEPLFRERRKHVQFVEIFVILVGLVGARFVLLIIFGVRNDVDVGTEALLRRELGIPHFFSLLRFSDVFLPSRAKVDSIETSMESTTDEAQRRAEHDTR